MANKLLENEIKHYKEIEKLQERIVYFTAMGSIMGCMLGGILGYMAGKEETEKEKTPTVQKITSQTISKDKQSPCHEHH